MADEALIKIEGIEEVCELLQQASRAAMPRALLHGLTAGAAVIEEYVAGRTPDKTGELLADLGTTVTLDSDFQGGIAEVGFGGKQGHVANFVEYGHRMVGHKPGKKELGNVEPHPFMRPAAEAAAEEAIEAFVDAVMADLGQAGIVDAA
jgi:HK97 gp10 family phage protein